MKLVHYLAVLLVVIGGLNWLLVGLFERDLLMMLGFEMADLLSKIVYVLVGLATVFEIFVCKKYCNHGARASTQASSAPYSGAGRM